MAAFKALDVHVHADFFENATASRADILLPAATSWEREGLARRLVRLRPLTPGGG